LEYILNVRLRNIHMSNTEALINHLRIKLFQTGSKSQYTQLKCFSSIRLHSSSFAYKLRISNIVVFIHPMLSRKICQDRWLHPNGFYCFMSTVTYDYNCLSYIKAKLYCQDIQFNHFSLLLIINLILI
jgi:hypothetical protein